MLRIFGGWGMHVIQLLVLLCSFIWIILPVFHLSDIWNLLLSFLEVKSLTIKELPFILLPSHPRFLLNSGSYEVSVVGLVWLNDLWLLLVFLESRPKSSYTVFIAEAEGCHVWPLWFCLHPLPTKTNPTRLLGHSFDLLIWSDES